MTPIYQVGDELYVVADVHLDEVVKDNERCCPTTCCDNCPVCCPDDEDDREEDNEDEDNGWCQGCDRDCDQCNCGCLLCEGFICIEPTKWKALRTAISNMSQHNYAHLTTIVTGMLDAEDL